MAVTTRTVITPFPAEFFDRFRKGETFLYIEFVERQPVRSVMDSRNIEETALSSLETFGIYAGREGENIKLDSGLVLSAEIEILVIRIVDIRGVKEIAPSEISEIISQVRYATEDILARPGDEIRRQVRFLNYLRAVINQRSLLLPYLRLS